MVVGENPIGACFDKLHDALAFLPRLGIGGLGIFCLVAQPWLPTCCVLDAYVACLREAYTMPWLPTLCVLVAYVLLWGLCLHDALVADVVCLRDAYTMPWLPTLCAYVMPWLLTRRLGCLRCVFWLPT